MVDVDRVKNFLRRAWALVFLIALILGVLLAQVSFSSTRLMAQPKPQRYTLLISIDGLSYVLLKKAIRQGYAPFLNKIAKEGFFRPIRTVFPSLTWPAHLSMLTGSQPSKQGIWGNRWIEDHEFVSPETNEKIKERIQNTRTLIELFQEKKQLVSSLRWPFSHTKAITYNIPAVFENYKLLKEYTSSNILPLLQSILAKKKSLNYIAENHYRLMKKMDGNNSWYDYLLQDIQKSLIIQTEKQPHFSLVHFTSVDKIQHNWGPNNIRALYALSTVDHLVQQLISAYREQNLLKDTNVFIVSDHGFLETNQAFDIRHIPAKSQRGYRVAYNGQTALVYFKENFSFTNSALKEQLMHPHSNQCIETSIPRRDYELLNIKAVKGPQSPDYILVSRTNCRFTRLLKKPLISTRTRGSHGYLPDHPLMKAVFLGFGPDIKKTEPKSLREANVIDIAPTISFALNLDSSSMNFDGEVLSDILY